MMTAAILAGGQSSRMGTDKALLPIGGIPLIQWMIKLLTPLFDEIIVVAGDAEKYDQLPATVYSDLIPGRGALGGVLTALEKSKDDWCFVLAVDMPLVRRNVLRILMERTRSVSHCDVVIPRNGEYLEPLFAFYHKRCIPAIRDVIQDDGFKIRRFFSKVDVCEVPVDEFKEEDPELLSLLNLNTLEDYQRALSYLGLDGLF